MRCTLSKFRFFLLTSLVSVSCFANPLRVQPGGNIFPAAPDAAWQNPALLVQEDSALFFQGRYASPSQTQPSQGAVGFTKEGESLGFGVSIADLDATEGIGVSSLTLGFGLDLPNAMRVGISVRDDNLSDSRYAQSIVFGLVSVFNAVTYGFSIRNDEDASILEVGFGYSDSATYTLELNFSAPTFFRGERPGYMVIFSMSVLQSFFGSSLTASYDFNTGDDSYLFNLSFHPSKWFSVFLRSEVPQDSFGMGFTLVF